MSTSEMKACPYCGEQILAVAVRCKHCHMMLDGAERTAGSTAPGSVVGSTGQGVAHGSQGGTPAGGTLSRLAVGSVLGSGRYQLTRLLGKGGMGEVFLAEHTYTAQKVAVKAVWPNLMSSEGPRKRFLQEGRVLAKLKHPNIVGLTDFFEEDGRFFLAMEYVEGETLGSCLDRRPVQERALPLNETLRILKGILGGLGHAHTQSEPVVHRDVKPSNVMLAKDGRVVLMDFGIAKVAGEEKITRTAAVVGTYEYMSPEQVSGQTITPASDVYAVGILAYELLTGNVPFPQKSDSGYDAMEGHRHKTPPPLLTRCPYCPPELAAWVSKALAKAPAERYADAQEMLEALGSLSFSTVSPVSPAIRTPAPVVQMVASVQSPRHRAGSARCPQCGGVTDTIKHYRLMQSMVFLGAWIRFSWRDAECCDECMRDEIVKSSISWSIITGWVAWIFGVLPYHVILYWLTYLPGHSASVQERLSSSAVDGNDIGAQ